MSVEPVTETLERDGLTVHFTTEGDRADVVVVDALTMEHAASLACALLTERGLDGEIRGRTSQKDFTTGKIGYTIFFILDDYLDPEKSLPLSTIW